MSDTILRIARHNVLLILVLLGSAFVGSTGPAAAQTPEPALAALTGTAYRLVDQTIVDGVVIDETEVPVTDGRIAIPELDIDMPLAADAAFVLSSLPVNADTDNATEVTVVFTAPGLGSYTYLHLRLYPGTVGPNLTPQMIGAPRVNDLTRPDTHGESSAEPDSFSPLVGQECPPSGDPSKFPQTIRVWENGPGQDGLVHTVNFKFYVKHVLPREWTASWHPESLRAGAMAVKSFAWWHASHTHTHIPGPQCYDVDAQDNHQVFNPDLDHPNTNAAVDATWNLYMIEGGDDVVHAMHKRGSDPEVCGEISGNPAPGNDMSQFGSKKCAEAGVLWPQILTTYYFPPPVSWTLVLTSLDHDFDGCSTLEEFGPNVALGGQRDYLWFWDFMDQWTGIPLARDKAVVANDISAIVARFGTFLPGGAPTKAQALAEALTTPTNLIGYHASGDRGGAELGDDPWELLPPDGSIVANDISALVAQFGHSCAAAP